MVARIVKDLARPFRGVWVIALAGLVPALVGCGNLPYLLPDLAGRVEWTTTATEQPAATRPADIQPSEDGAATGEAANLSVDRIAYISPYGDLFTINADGTEERRLTGGSQVRNGPPGPIVPIVPAGPSGVASPSGESETAGVYTVQNLDFNYSYAWPTWSPDGTRLAVSRVRIAGNRSLEVSVQVIDAITGRSRMVYENDVPAMVADGTPHYLYWSPDGEYLSFLAATRQGLTLFAVNPDTTEGAVALERGAPLYYSWGGNSLIVHSREEVKLFQSPITPGAGLLMANSVGFRTPALSPDGRRWAYAAGDAAGSAIYVSEGDDSVAPRRVLDTGPLTAFMWSPDGQWLAVADHQDPQGRIFQRIQLVAADGSGVRTLVEEPLLAFYWAPNGERLSWVSVDMDDQVFEWKVASIMGRDAAAQAGGDEVAAPAGDGSGSEPSGESDRESDITASTAADGVVARELFRFRPSGEVFTMLSFFDQYAYSHSPWSPDSTRLVVAGAQGPVEERRNGHTPSGARVYVLDAVGDAPPLEIAGGGVAFWSWN